MPTTPRRLPLSEPGALAGPMSRLPGTLLVALMLGWSGCGSTPQSGTPRGGEGGSDETGGQSGSGGNAGSGGQSGSGGNAGKKDAGSPGGSGGGGGGSGGATTRDAASSSPDTGGGAAPDAAAPDTSAAGTPDAGMPSSDGPPAVARPDVMGQACAEGRNYAFTGRTFPAQTGTFTAFFTANPGAPPTNSVIGLSDGQKYLHDHFAAIVRFGTSGMLDVRNGTGYMSATPIKYANTDYHFRLVVNIPAQTYSAYVSYDGMPEVTLGTNLMFRDSAGKVNMMNYWAVEAVAGETTRVCGFLVVPN